MYCVPLYGPIIKKKTVEIVPCHVQTDILNMQKRNAQLKNGLNDLGLARRACSLCSICTSPISYGTCLICSPYSCIQTRPVVHCHSPSSIDFCSISHTKYSPPSRLCSAYSIRSPIVQPIVNHNLSVCSYQRIGLPNLYHCEELTASPVWMSPACKYDCLL
jgi:hypothetical protein